MMTNTPHPPDPLTEILQHHPLPDIAAALRANLDEIIRRWADAARARLPHATSLTYEHLRDHLPDGLARIADALHRGGDGEALRALDIPAAQIAHTRLEQDWDLTEVILEYRLLRHVALDVLEQSLARPLTRHEFFSLDAGIVALLQRTVRTYVDRQQARQQEFLDTESRFLAYMSHDLRNHLNAVTLSLQSLRQDLEDRPGTAQAVDDLDAAQQAIAATVDGMERMLQLERVRHAVTPKSRPVDLCSIEADVTRRFAPLAASKGLKLDIECPPTPVVLDTDPDLLSIALQNLIGNAVKFCPHGTVRVGVHWLGVPAASDCLVSVSDEGPGIPPDQQQRLFQAFEHGPTQLPTGTTGLGLTIAAQAVRTLGGHLTLSSHPNTGTTFQFLLHPPAPHA